MAKVIMVQGTMSNAGKSLLVGGLCRVFRQDGYRVAPFKSQNMALNSFVTRDGLEMGRAQVMQAECAGIEPSVYMNPILLKPTGDIGSQVIVNGEVLRDMPAREYFAYKTRLIPDILEAFQHLAAENDIIVIEGAGSPAEINLKENDIVNMGLAEMVDAPVLLVGDIDRGGVFAQLYGTVALLPEPEKARIGGMIINKFRGDASLLDSGIEMLEEKTGIPVIGTVPYRPLNIDDEDSLSSHLEGTGLGLVTIGVIRFPHISNFTDITPLESMPGVGVVYIENLEQFKKYQGYLDLLILPGTKNTLGDLRWLQDTGLKNRIHMVTPEIPVIGICGGYQMMGLRVSDPDGVEDGGEEEGLRLLSVETTLQKKKHRKQVKGKIHFQKGIFEGLPEMAYHGYEIHIGETETCDEDVLTRNAEGEVNGQQECNVYGTYVHGIFDEDRIATAICQRLAEKKGVTLPKTAEESYQSIREKEYDKLADLVRENLNMKKVYGMLREASISSPKEETKTKETLEYVKPRNIEKRSFEIIQGELERRGIRIPAEQDRITRRVIHTTADFEYGETMCYSEGAIEAGLRALRQGATIVTDTNMTRSGINKKFLATLGGEVRCFMADEDVAKEAKERGVTRATVSMERAAEIPGPVIVSVGNAPTALISLHEIMSRSDWRPALIIGVPVGFVNVVPAKELILDSDVPHIVNRGRKGGSNVAAAICNALLYQIRDEQKEQREKD